MLTMQISFRRSSTLLLVSCLSTTIASAQSEPVATPSKPPVWARRTYVVTAPPPKVDDKAPRVITLNYTWRLD